MISQHVRPGSLPSMAISGPTGIPVCRGQGYQALMTVDAQNGSNDDALWRFNFDIDGDYPPC